MQWCDTVMLPEMTGTVYADRMRSTAVSIRQGDRCYGRPLSYIPLNYTIFS